MKVYINGPGYMDTLTPFKISRIRRLLILKHSLKHQGDKTPMHLNGENCQNVFSSFEGKNLKEID